MDRRKFLTGSAIAATGVAASAAPALAQKKTKMNIISTWQRDFPGLGISAQRLAARIQELTEGRIEVSYHAMGERVSDLSAVFTGVTSGNYEAYIAADYYWKGTHPAWVYFCAVPFGLTYTEMDAWMKFGGGQQLLDKVAGQYGLKNFPCGNTGVQMGGWYRKEINTVEDLEGLKIRMPGLGGEVMTQLKAQAVTLPGNVIFDKLMNGTIDATEWVGPFNDEDKKFFQAAKFYYYPGMHEPGAQLCLGMNKAWWSKLSKTDQLIIETACADENARSMAEANMENGPALQRLQKDHGVKLREFSDEIYEAFGEAAETVFEKVRGHSKLANEVHESFLAARKNVGTWMKLSDIAYSQKRNDVLGI